MSSVLRTYPGTPVCFKEPERFSREVVLGGSSWCFDLRAGWGSLQDPYFQRTTDQLYKSSAEMLWNPFPWERETRILVQQRKILFFQGISTFHFTVIRQDQRRESILQKDSMRPLVRSHVTAPGGEGSGASPGRPSRTTKQPATNAGFATKSRKW